jgi:hypothetical protein
MDGKLRCHAGPGIAALMLAVAAGSALAAHGRRGRETAALGIRLAAVAGRSFDGCRGGRWVEAAAGAVGRGLPAALASWQTVGGCGAGASNGTGGGVKWVGRHVTGGVVNLECQASYVDTPYGYNFVGNTLLTGALGDRWSLGVAVPYLYKYMRDPYAVGIDLANKGPGDVSVAVTHRMGATREWLASAAVGLPTGVNDREFRMEPLPQDRQLGLGTPSGQLVLDHVADQLWGAAIVGGSLNWRGLRNDVGSSRAPSASVYGYLSYLVGAFAPSVGLTLTGFAGNDRDRSQEQAMPVAVLAPSLSLEWSADWIALLANVTTPYELGVHGPMVSGRNQPGNWMFTLGTAFILY